MPLAPTDHFTPPTLEDLEQIQELCGIFQRNSRNFLENFQPKLKKWQDCFHAQLEQIRPKLEATDIENHHRFLRAQAGVQRLDVLVKNLSSMSDDCLEAVERMKKDIGRCEGEALTIGLNELNRLHENLTEFEVRFTDWYTNEDVTIDFFVEYATGTPKSNGNSFIYLFNTAKDWLYMSAQKRVQEILSSPKNLIFSCVRFIIITIFGIA